VRGAPFRPPFALVWAAVLSINAACELTVKTSDLEGGCPRQLPGPSLVKVDSPSGAYCVDSTEVSNAHYQAFVDAHGPDAVADIRLPGCGGVTSLKPDVMGWPVDGLQNLPVGRANWCQAAAYCQWAGKRLCGKIGGGTLADTFKNDTTVAQWFNACSRGNTRVFPYGNDYDPSLCIGPTDAGPGKPYFVGARRGCEGGYPGLFDMSGNLWEWTDNCDDPNGANNNCRACGGAFDSAPPTEFQCSQCRPWGRTAFATDIGFRCCKDL